MTSKVYNAFRAKMFGPRILLDRVVVRRETEKLIKGLPFESMDALEISGDGWKTLPFKSFRAANYPEHDICACPVENNIFDIVIAEQVFEHLAYPYRAAKNIYASLKAGGYFLISTPFLQQVHNFPIDCSRWTPIGMKYFLDEAGFPIEDTQIGSWGNRGAVKANMRRTTELLKWPPTYNPIFHRLKNDDVFPVQVWALARKPGAVA